jgi:excisionase family DNA binding protein
MQTDNRLVLTVTEVAAALGISRAHAYELIARGELASVRLGRRIVVPRQELERIVGGDADGCLGADLMPDGLPLVLTVTEVAAALGISRAHAYGLVARGELPSLRLGRRIVVPRRELNLLLDGHAGHHRAA